MRTHSLLAALAAAVTVVAFAGCTTQFYGEPTFPGGARGCWDRCRSEGLEMSAFVYMGEYSNGCVCRVRTTGDVTPATPSTPAPPAPPATAPDAVPPAPPAPDADVQASVAAGTAAVAVMVEQAPTRRQ